MTNRLQNKGIAPADQILTSAGENHTYTSDSGFPLRDPYAYLQQPSQVRNSTKHQLWIIIEVTQPHVASITQ